MNTRDIKLPPLPPGYTSYEFPDGGYDADEMQAYARAAIEPYAKRIAQLEAARFAYASEFPPNEDGDPDVGSIHENIRKLKAELEADRQGRGRPVFAWYDPTTGLFTRNKDDPDSGIPAGSCLWPLYREAPTLHNSDSGAPNAEPVGYIMPTALKQLRAGGNAIVGGVSQGCDVPIYTAPQPAESCASLISDKPVCGSENGDCDSQPAKPVSTHHVHRGVESLPCYCKGKDDHPIGKETLEPVKSLSAGQLAEILTAYITPEIIGEALEKLENAPWELSAPVKMPNALPSGTKYSVEPHGNGYAIYQGRDKLHHGANLAHLSECTPEFSKRIESALNAMSEPVKVPSDDDIIELRSEFDWREHYGNIRFARALLARYGNTQQEQP